MPTRDEQKQLRKMKILNAALDQFIKRGYAATKVSHIAEAANMSVGLLFHYFKSKEQLYIELIEIGIDGPSQMIDSVAMLAPLQFFTTIAELILQYAKESEFTAKMFVLMNSAFYSEGIPLKARKLALQMDFYTLAEVYIKKGQQDGTIRMGDSLALSTAFWTALQGAVSAYALIPNSSLPEAEWIIDIIKEKQIREEN